MRRRDQARFFGMPRDNFDWALFLTASALAVIGVVNLYSATSVSRAALSEIYIQQVYWLVLGGILGAVVTVIDYRHYERLGYVLYGVGIVLLLLVFILGKDIRGSSRWISIGSFSFQPSEFMKLFMESPENGRRNAPFSGVTGKASICGTRQRDRRACREVGLIADSPPEVHREFVIPDLTGSEQRERRRGR